MKYIIDKEVNNILENREKELFSTLCMDEFGTDTFFNQFFFAKPNQFYFFIYYNMCFSNTEDDFEKFMKFLQIIGEQNFYHGPYSACGANHLLDRITGSNCEKFEEYKGYAWDKAVMADLILTYGDSDEWCMAQDHFNEIIVISVNKNLVGCLREIYEDNLLNINEVMDFLRRYHGGEYGHIKEEAQIRLKQWYAS